MNRPTKIVANCETGIVETIELTDEEIAQIEADRAALAAQEAQREAERLVKQSQKESAIVKLTALGLTEEEVAALL